MANVSATDITKIFGGTSVLNSVSLDVRDGEFLTLVGPSGCGKSTLLRIIAGLERQNFGSVAIDGKAVDAVRPKMRNVAMVFQSYALYPYMTAEENIALPLVMRKLTAWQRLPLIGSWMPGARARRAEIAREVQDVANALGLGPLLSRKPSQMSGGQRQRVALGRAMVRHPDVFLMDEPLSNLDAKLRVQMREEITGLHRRLGATFIYVTHDQAEAMTMSDRVAVMKSGDILQLASPQQIYSDPENIEVAKFIGSPQINLIPSIVNEKAELEIFDMKVAGILPASIRPGMSVTIGLRPEALKLALDDSSDGLLAHVTYVESLGSDSYIHAKLVDRTTAVIARATPAEAATIGNGTRVRLRFSPKEALIFSDNGERLRSNNCLPILRKVGG